MVKIFKKKNQDYSQETASVLSVAFEMGFVIALPILVFALLGKWLDQKQHTHYFVLIGILLALGCSCFWLYRRFSEMIKKLEQAAKIKYPKEKLPNPSDNKGK